LQVHVHGPDNLLCHCEYGESKFLPLSITPLRSFFFFCIGRLHVIRSTARMHFFVRGRAGQAFVFERRGPPQVREGAPVVDLFAKKMRGPLAKKKMTTKKKGLFAGGPHRQTGASTSTQASCCCCLLV
jgi:hypothetical protein